MPITLRDAVSQLQLRPTTTPVDQLALEREQMLGADANPIRQGWVSAGAGMDAYDLLAQANAAERQGDLRSAQALELQAKDHLARAQAWAPTTQKFTDIDGPGSAANWLGGQIGNLRTSVAPMVGGVAGRIAGGLAGGLVAGPAGAAIGANLGGLGGAFIPGYNLEYNESVGQAMLDPQIRAQRTAEEIHRTAQGKGAVAGALESIVPAGVGKLAVEGVGKRAIGKTITKEMGEEALTEGSQNLVGQAAQNHLRGDPMTQFDYQDAFNDAMAGAVGGGTMAGGGVAIGKARDALVGGAEKVADIARDPTGAVIDKIKSAAEARGRKMAQEEIASESPEQTVERVFGKKPPSITDSLRDDEREMDDATLDRTRHEQAMADAQEVLSAPAGMYSQAEKEAAAQFQAGQLSWDKVREVRRQGEADRKSIDDVNELLRAAGLDDKGETKSSLMRPNGSEGNPGKFGEVTRRVAMLQRKYDNKATQEAAQRTVTVADVLVSGGYWPKEIVDAAKSTTQKEGMLTTASTLLTWMKYGMQDKRYENDDSLVDALVGKYGEAAVGMLQNAYDVGVSSGLMPRNDELFAERRVQALDALKQQEDLSGVVLKNLSAEWKRHVLKNVSGKWIEDKTALASLVREVRRIASTGGSREDERVMEILFPNEENRHEVRKALYTPSISKHAFGTESKVTQIGREQGETSRAGKTSRSVDDLDSEDYERQVDKLSGESDESDEGGETSEARGVKYIHAPGGHAFRKRDEGSRAAMKAAKEKHAGNGVRVEEVGVVDAALDKARVAAGGQLSTEQRHQVLEKLARRYLRRDMPQRPATPPEDASALTKSVHKQDLQKWQAKLERTAKALNRTHVVLKSSAVDEEKSGELDYEAVRAAQLDRKLDDPRNRPEEGVLWIGTKRGAKMLISAPQILRLAFRSGEAHQDVGFSGKTKEGDEVTVGFGSPQNIYNMLLRSLGDISLMPEFNGTWGFVEAGGTPVQVAGKTVLPDNFTLLKKTPKRDALTMADVGRAKADYDRRISSLKDGDVDPDSFGGRVKKITAVGQMWAMLKNNDLKNPDDAPKLEEFLNDLSNGEIYPDDIGYLVGKWKRRLGIIGKKATELRDGVGEDQGRTRDGLAAYDPDKTIVRGEDDRGMVTAGEVEMTAQTVVGTPKKLDAEGVKSLTGPVPSVAVDSLASSPEKDLAAEKQQVMRDWVVETLMQSKDALLAGIGEMNAGELEVLFGTLFGKDMRVEEKVMTSDPRFENGTAYRQYDKDLGGVRTKATGEVARRGPHLKGLSDLSAQKIAAMYFNRSITKGLFFKSQLDKAKQEIQAKIEARVDTAEVENERGLGLFDEVESEKNRSTSGSGQADSGRTEARVVARRNGERARSQSDDGAVDQERRADRPAGNGRGALLDKLRTIKPANAIHKRAVENLIALLEGKKEGNIAKAMNDMVRWDQTLGDLSVRQREQLKTWVEKRGGQEDTQVPIEAYDDELAYDPEQAEYDRAQVTGKDSKQEPSQEANSSLTRQDGWVMRVAAMSLKEMRSYISKMPYEKLDRAFDILDSFYPVNTSNAFWQRNDLDLYTEKMDEVIAEAQDVIRDRLHDEAPTSIETKDSRIATEIAKREPRQLFAPQWHEGFAKALDKVRDAIGRGGKWAQEALRDMLPVGRTPVVLRAVIAGMRNDGNPDRPFRRSEFLLGKGSTLYLKGLDQHGASAHGDTVPYSTLRNLPALLANPIAVFKSSERGADENSFKILIDATSEKGAPVVVAIKPAVQIEGFNGALGNFVATVFPTSQANIEAWNREGLLRYYDDRGTPGSATRVAPRAYPNDSVTSRSELSSLGGRGRLAELGVDPSLGTQKASVKVVSASELESLPEAAWSEQGVSGDKQATPEEMAQVEAELHRILGDDVRVLFEDLGGKSGEWTKEDTAAVIRLAVNGDIMATGFHEAIHQLFSLLKQHQGQAVVDALQRIATSPVMQGRLRKLLKAHPEAMGQLSDPEEAVAYMFQFWMMDPSGFKLGPETKTLFQKIKSMLDKAFALLSKTVRDRLVNEQRGERDAMMAEYLMTKLASGVMADKTGRTAVVEALNADAAKHNAALTHLGDGYTKLITGVGRFFATAEGLLESYNNPHLTMLARQMHQRAGEAMGSKAGYLEAVRFVSNHYEAKINAILANHSKDDLELARSWLVQHPDKAHPSPEVNEVVGKIQGFLKEMRGYIEKMGIRRLEGGKWVAIDFRKHYFPHVWDTAAVSENMEQFVLDLMNEHGDKLEAIAKEAGVSTEEVAQTILKRVMNPNAQVDLEETTSDLGMTPAATAINRRSLDWLNMEVFDKYMSKDLGQILHSYTHNIVQRGEYQSRFGYGGEKLKETVDSALLHQMGGESLTTRAVVAMPEYERQWEERRAAAEAAGREFSEPYPTLRSVGTDLFKKDEGAEAETKIKDALTALEPAFKTIMAMEGTLGNDITPGLRKAENWITTYQNFRVLAPGLFSSFMDIMGVVREGGEFKDAWGAFVAGIKEAKNIMQDKRDDSYMMQRAELFGSADAGSFSSAVGQHSTSVYMSGKAKEWSDKLFKYNGMEGWNRGVRAYATLVAERILLDWARNGVNSKDPAEVARVERLFGKGFDVSKIKLDDSGNVDATDPKNIAAVNRWVHDAVIAPNAAHRPYWMSDPHFQVVAHLKSFSYSAHAVMLKQVAAQARLGNYRPALVTLLGYAPIAIAAGAIKEMLIPGDEPPWMKGGLDGYLEYGWDRAGVLGIPQMYAQNLFDSDPVAAFGPTANQVQDLLTVPLGELKVGPVGWRDHRTFEEMMGAAPFGSVLRRYGADVDDWIAK